MMNTPTILTLIGLGAIAAICANAYRRYKAEQAIRNGIDIKEIEAAKPELKRLKEESIRDTEAYRIAKEKYDAKYRSNRPGIKPSSKPGPGNN